MELILGKTNIFIWARSIKFEELQVQKQKLVNTGNNNLIYGVHYSHWCIQYSAKTSDLYTFKYKNEQSFLKLKFKSGSNNCKENQASVHESI